MPGYPGAVLYGPVKAMIIKFAQGVHAELSAEGIHCCAVCPGFTMTEFHDANGTRDDADKIPGFMWMDAPTVAQQSYDAVMAGKSIYVNGALNRALAGLVRVLPDRLSTRLAGQRPNAPEN